MLSRKYVKDYKFSETLTPKGRIRTEAVYTGDYFRFSDPAAAAGERKLLPWLSALMWIVFLAPLFPHSTASRIIYVVFPYALLVFPLFRITEASFELRHADEKMIRSKAERFSVSLPSAALFSAVLSGIVLAGLAVMAFLNFDGLVWADLLFALADIVIFGLSLFIRKRKGRLLVTEL